MVFSNMTKIRVKDEGNPFVDCIVIVPANEQAVAVTEIRVAMEKYRAYEYDTYFEAIEAMLIAQGIQFTIIRRPWNDDYDCPDIIDEVWESVIAGFDGNTIAA